LLLLMLLLLLLLPLLLLLLTSPAAATVVASTMLLLLLLATAQEGLDLLHRTSKGCVWCSVSRLCRLFRDKNYHIWVSISVPPKQE